MKNPSKPRGAAFIHVINFYTHRKKWKRHRALWENWAEIKKRLQRWLSHLALIWQDTYRHSALSGGLELFTGNSNVCRWTNMALCVCWTSLHHQLLSWLQRRTAEKFIYLHFWTDHTFFKNQPGLKEFEISKGMEWLQYTKCEFLKKNVFYSFDDDFSNYLQSKAIIRDVTLSVLWMTQLLSHHIIAQYL